MSSSSQQITSSVTSSDIASLKLDDIITLTTSDTFNTSTINTITLTGTGTSSTYNWNYGTTGTIGGSSGISTVTLGPLTADDIQINIPEEWAGCFPSWHRVEAMCKQYPALKIALRNFQTVYELVKDDYDNPAPKR